LITKLSCSIRLTKYLIKIFIRELKRQYLEFEIESAGLSFTDEVDFDKACTRGDRLEKLKTLLEMKKVEVMSTKWMRVKGKVKFCRLTCEHEWDAQGNAFFISRRKSGCDRCARSKAGQSRLQCIEKPDSFAKSFGGACLSGEYFGRKHKYEKRCEDGYLLLGDIKNMKFRNKLSSECNKAKN
jgi:hypothetical protein